MADYPDPYISNLDRRDGVGSRGGATGPVIVIEDPVNHPSHYTRGHIEVIDFIEDQALGYHLGNVIKYVTRAGHKNNELEDLKKARWYLNRRIEALNE